jgi:hypothetical protein
MKKASTMRTNVMNAAILVGFCVAATLLITLDEIPTDDDQSSSWIEVRRSLRAVGIYPWAEHNLVPLTEMPDPDNETPLFWHIPKSGGTTAKAMYECLGMTLVNRAGALPQFGHDHDEELIAFKPFGKRGPTYVNADSTTESGILHAEELGLVPSGLADIIITGVPQFAVSHLYDKDHKGRAFGIFRHPVERLVSKFYYLQIAWVQFPFFCAWNSWHFIHSHVFSAVAVQGLGKDILSRMERHAHSPLG